METGREKGIKVLSDWTCINRRSGGVAEAGRTPVRVIGNIAHDVTKLLKLLALYEEPRRLQVVYETGPRRSHQDRPPR